MQPAVIRAMSIADLDRVLEIAANERYAPTWSRSAYLTAINPNSEPRRIALVIEDGVTGRITGFVVARLMPPEAELETIVTAAGFQRRGLARQLFADLAAKLKSAGATEIHLELRESNHPAMSLYYSLGFIVIGRRTAYYVDPIEDAVMMHSGLVYPPRG
jgi:ribosomal-protein-alanine N-acetyltransferase